jgi:hypothetical protein
MRKWQHGSCAHNGDSSCFPHRYRGSSPKRQPVPCLRPDRDGCRGTEVVVRQFVIAWQESSNPSSAALSRCLSSDLAIWGKNTLSQTAHVFLVAKSTCQGFFMRRMLFLPRRGNESFTEARPARNPPSVKGRAAEQLHCVGSDHHWTVLA